MKKVGTQSRYGFTIVELLIVIVIIGILAALAVVAYNGIQQRALATTLQNDLRNAAQALERAKIDNGDIYPTTFPTDFKTDTKVTLNLADAGSTTAYCINGTIQGGTGAWKYDKTDGGLKEGVCSGQIIAGSDVGGGGTKVNYVANPNFTGGWGLIKAAGTATTSTRSGTSGDPSGNRPVLILQNNASTPSWAYIEGGMNAPSMQSGKSYGTSYWARITNGSSIQLRGAGVMDGSAANVVLANGGTLVTLTSTWKKITNTQTAAITGLSSSRFYIHVGTPSASLNQSVTIELQDPRVEEQ